jgi:hypothetical protein
MGDSWFVGLCMIGFVVCIGLMVVMAVMEVVAVMR